MIFLLCAVMAVMAYVAYKVGLAAHNRRVSLGNASPLVVLLTMAGLFLTTAYFVVFHGMDGQTIGKLVFRLARCRRGPAADQLSTRAPALARNRRIWHGEHWIEPTLDTLEPGEARLA